MYICTCIYIYIYIYIWILLVYIYMSLSVSVSVSVSVYIHLFLPHTVYLVSSSTVNRGRCSVCREEASNELIKQLKKNQFESVSVYSSRR